MAIDDGGPAFPQHPQPGCLAPAGMSLRDWFAGQALAGLTASSKYELFEETNMAAVCYAQADAMLAQRKKEDSDADHTPAARIPEARQ